MLKANVGLSRKISRDYQSTGYSVNIEGEILASADDSEAVLVRVQELFHLAQEAIGQEIDRDQGERAIGRRDEEPPPPRPEAGGENRGGRPDQGDGKAPRQSNGEAATNKQIQFLLTVGKRFKLSTSQLEGRVAEIVGRRCGVYDLTKKEAGLVLDRLTKSAEGNGKAQQGG